MGSITRISLFREDFYLITQTLMFWAGRFKSIPKKFPEKFFKIQY